MYIHAVSAPFHHDIEAVKLSGFYIHYMYVCTHMSPCIVQKNWDKEYRVAENYIA